MLCLLHYLRILTCLTHSPSINRLDTLVSDTQVFIEHLREDISHTLLAGKIKTIIRNWKKVKILVPVISTQWEPCIWCWSTLFEDWKRKHGSWCNKIKRRRAKTKLNKKTETNKPKPNKKRIVYPWMNITNWWFD